MVGVAANATRNVWSAIEHRHRLARLVAPRAEPMAFKRSFKAVCASSSGTNVEPEGFKRPGWATAWYWLAFPRPASAGQSATDFGRGQDGHGMPRRGHNIFTAASACEATASQRRCRPACQNQSCFGRSGHGTALAGRRYVDPVDPRVLYATGRAILSEGTNMFGRTSGKGVRGSQSLEPSSSMNDQKEATSLGT